MMSPNSMPPSSASPYQNQDNNQQQNPNSVFNVAQQIQESQDSQIFVDDNFEMETYIDSGIKQVVVENKLELDEVENAPQADLVKTITFDSLDIK